MVSVSRIFICVKCIIIDKAITSNLAIVPSANEEIEAYADASTNLIL